MHIVFSILFLALFLAPKYVAPAILLIFLFTVYQVIKKNYTLNFSKWLLLLPVLFGLYLIGCLYSQNTEGIGFEIESRLSFVVFPLLFFFIPYDEIQFRKTTRIYLLIALVSIVFCLLNAMSCTEELQYGGQCYLKKYLAYQLHTSYISFYYLFAILLMVYYRIKKRPLFNRSIEIIATITLLIFIIFFTSKAAYLSVFLLFLMAVVYLVFVKSGRYIRWIGLSLFLIFSVGFIFYPNPIKSKLSKSYEAIQNFRNNKEEFFEFNKDKAESSAARIIIWDITWNEIKKHPLGVGTSDIKPYLIQKYEEKGFDKIAERKLNPHNQFLQTGLAIGFPGILILLISFLLPMITALKKKEYLIFGFMALFLLNCFFESMLELQAGIVFFSFLFSLFMKKLSTKNTFDSN